MTLKEQFVEAYYNYFDVKRESVEQFYVSECFYQIEKLSCLHM
jgi:hypothetical protein